MSPRQKVLSDTSLEKLLSILTVRDYKILRVLYDHRVLTTGQLQTAFFSSGTSARRRLFALHAYGLLNRFKPPSESGSYPFHYLISELGRTVLGETPKRTDGIGLQNVARLARSSHLAHLVASQKLFIDLLGAARSDQSANLELWWSQWDCRQNMGGLVIPDGFGIWERNGKSVEFCLELDRGTEPHKVLLSKFDGYRELEKVTGKQRTICFVFLRERRESEVRRAMRGQDLAIATALLQNDLSAASWRSLETQKSTTLEALSKR